MPVGFFLVPASPFYGRFFSIPFPCGREPQGMGMMVEQAAESFSFLLPLPFLFVQLFFPSSRFGTNSSAMVGWWPRIVRNPPFLPLLTPFILSRFFFPPPPHLPPVRFAFFESHRVRHGRESSHCAFPLPFPLGFFFSLFAGA